VHQRYEPIQNKCATDMIPTKAAKPNALATHCKSHNEAVKKPVFRNRSPYPARHVA
jgi:hypothetical protein